MIVVVYLQKRMLALYARLWGTLQSIEIGINTEILTSAK